MIKKLPDLEYEIVQLVPDPRMNGNRCIVIEEGKTATLYIDKRNWIKVGDTVRIERNEHGSFEKMWINGTLNKKFNPPKK